MVEELAIARTSKWKSVPGANEDILYKDPQYEEMMALVAANFEENAMIREEVRGSSTNPILNDPQALVQVSNAPDVELFNFQVPIEPLP